MSDNMETNEETLNRLHLTNEETWNRLRLTLDPPFQSGEQIVICDGEIKARFTSDHECAKYILTVLKSECFIYREPRIYDCPSVEIAKE